MTNICYSDANEEKSLQLLGDCLHILENQFEIKRRGVEDNCGCGKYKCQVLKDALWYVNQYQQEDKKMMVSKFVENAVKFKGPMSTMSTCRSVTDTHEFHHNISVVGSDLESEEYTSPLHTAVQLDGNLNEDQLLEVETVYEESVVKEAVVPTKIVDDRGFSIDRSKFSYIPPTPIIIPSFLTSVKPNVDQKSQPISVTPNVLPDGIKIGPSTGLGNKWPSTLTLSKPVPLKPPMGWTPRNYWSSHVGYFQSPLWRVL